LANTSLNCSSLKKRFYCLSYNISNFDPTWLEPNRC